MKGTTITGVVTETIIYDSANYPGPLTITATGAIMPSAAGTDGIDIPKGIDHAKISNAGTIAGAINGGTGIEARSSAAITNAGSILGGGTSSSKNDYKPGGIGVALHAGGTIDNSGIIKGGAGGYKYGRPYGGYNGGAAVAIYNGGKISNSGAITGGAGAGGYGRSGMGGAGVDLTGGTLQNSGAITGGGGGNYYNGGGGPGGDGVDAQGSAKIMNSGHITGGEGGDGGAPGGIGVYLLGGNIINAASGVIAGGYGGGGGEESYGGNGGIGVQISDGAHLADLGGITGGNGAYGYYGGGSGNLGVSITNATAVIEGTVTGGYGAFGRHSYGGTGIYMKGGSLTVTSTGAVTGGGGYNSSGVAGAGLRIDGGTALIEGTVSGGAGASAYGYGDGATLSGGGTLIVAGTISGGLVGGFDYNDAVSVSGAGATLELDPGAVFNGLVEATGPGDLLDLAGKGAGTITGLGSEFTGFGTVSELAKADWSITGNNSLADGTALSVAGILSVTGTLTAPGSATISGKGALLAANGGFVHVGDLTMAGGTLATDATSSVAIGSGATHPPAGMLKVEAGFAVSGFGTIGSAGTADIVDNGSITAHGGTLTLDASTSGTGGIAIGSGSALFSAFGTISTASLAFGAGGNETLHISAASTITTPISGFGTGDTIDVAKSAQSLAFDSGTLTLLNGGQVVETLVFAGNYTLADFALHKDGHGGSDITYAGADPKITPAHWKLSVAPPADLWMHFFR
jgi:hypothetical protein